MRLQHWITFQIGFYLQSWFLSLHVLGKDCQFLVFSTVHTLESIIIIAAQILKQGNDEGHKGSKLLRADPKRKSIELGSLFAALPDAKAATTEA